MPLLEKEIEVIGKLNTKIIAVGKEVFRYLRANSRHQIVSVEVIHYAWTAARHRKTFAQKHFDEYKKFEFPDPTNIVTYSDCLMKKANFEKLLLSETLGRLSSRPDLRKGILVDYSKRLLFHYAHCFEKIREMG